MRTMAIRTHVPEALPCTTRGGVGKKKKKKKNRVLKWTGDKQDLEMRAVFNLFKESNAFGGRVP